MDQSLITVAKLIERCVPPSPDQVRTWRRRLRDLTTIRAVPAAERQHEGTGRYRLYAPDIIPLVAVMLRLGDRGVQISNLSRLAQVILHPQKADRDTKQIWDSALAHDLRDHEEAWLAIAPIPIAGGVNFRAGFGSVWIRDAPGTPDTWIVTYLSRIFRQIKAAGQSEGEGR
jgi:DNA-binding transcriptional MerR regulator